MDKQSPRKINNSRAVGAALGVTTTRSVRELELSGILPPPDIIIGIRKFWYDETIAEAQQRLAERSKGRRVYGAAAEAADGRQTRRPKNKIAAVAHGPTHKHA